MGAAGVTRWAVGGPLIVLLPEVEGPPSHVGDSEFGGVEHDRRVVAYETEITVNGAWPYRWGDGDIVRETFGVDTCCEGA
ncbi:hypothetical protein EW146_g222 [Bondarzewia mesenterica]|uniref:Uncharacterized protein n=1 Tax=Bondarzewia mesenterica TaxID=1095465 RepID=A0A4S4M7Y0_9AGAM|nr:hypothetical protein EW146_g222 [Bondarzewia mesenterica]